MTCYDASIFKNTSSPSLLVVQHSLIVLLDRAKFSISNYIFCWIVESRKCFIRELWYVVSSECGIVLNNLIRYSLNCIWIIWKTTTVQKKRRKNNWIRVLLANCRCVYYNTALQRSHRQNCIRVANEQIISHVPHIIEFNWNFVMIFASVQLLAVHSFSGSKSKETKTIQNLHKKIQNETFKRVQRATWFMEYIQESTSLYNSFANQNGNWFRWITI